MTTQEILHSAVIRMIQDMVDDSLLNVTDVGLRSLKAQAHTVAAMLEAMALSGERPTKPLAS